MQQLIRYLSELASRDTKVYSTLQLLTRLISCTPLTNGPTHLLHYPVAAGLFGPGPILPVAC
jgi:hypothetical protein